jgi:hypothetical protein
MDRSGFGKGFENEFEQSCSFDAFSGSEGAQICSGGCIQVYERITTIVLLICDCPSSVICHSAHS